MSTLSATALSHVPATAISLVIQPLPHCLWHCTWALLRHPGSALLHNPLCLPLPSLVLPPAPCLPLSMASPRPHTFGPTLGPHSRPLPWALPAPDPWHTLAPPLTYAWHHYTSCPLSWHPGQPMMSSLHYYNIICSAQHHSWHVLTLRWLCSCLTLLWHCCSTIMSSMTPPWHASVIVFYRLCPWCHAPGPMPQISDPMTSYIMLMDYTLCPSPSFYSYSILSFLIIVHSH